jgi:hypothetical protein
MAKKITPQCIADAHARIAPYVNHTPLLESSLLNGWLGHRIIFKAESFQKVGAFNPRIQRSTSRRQINDIHTKICSSGEASGC